MWLYTDLRDSAWTTTTTTITTTATTTTTTTTTTTITECHSSFTCQSLPSAIQTTSLPHSMFSVAVFSHTMPTRYSTVQNYNAYENSNKGVMNCVWTNYNNNNNNNDNNEEDDFWSVPSRLRSMRFTIALGYTGQQQGT